MPFASFEPMHPADGARLLSLLLVVACRGEERARPAKVVTSASVAAPATASATPATCKPDVPRSCGVLADHVCAYPLRDYCVEGTGTKRYVACRRLPPTPTPGEAVKKGYRIVARNGMFGGYTEVYDRGGELAYAELWTDVVEYCEGRAGMARFGERPAPDVP